MLWTSFPDAPCMGASAVVPAWPPKKVGIQKSRNYSLNPRMAATNRRHVFFGLPHPQSSWYRWEKRSWPPSSLHVETGRKPLQNPALPDHQGCSEEAFRSPPRRGEAAFGPKEQILTCRSFAKALQQALETQVHPSIRRSQPFVHPYRALGTHTCKPMPCQSLRTPQASCTALRSCRLAAGSRITLCSAGPHLASASQQSLYHLLRG